MQANANTPGVICSSYYRSASCLQCYEVEQLSVALLPALRSIFIRARRLRRPAEFVNNIYHNILLIIIKIKILVEDSRCDVLQN